MKLGTDVLIREENLSEKCERWGQGPGVAADKQGNCHCLISSTSTLWSYKLILKHLLNYRTKLHYIDFVWPLTPSSLMDIWYIVSNKQVICQKSLEMAFRKNVRFLGLAQIDPFSDEGFLKIIWYFCYLKAAITYYWTQNTPQQLTIITAFIYYPSNQ